ncbi:TolC family protein [Sphingomonas beigongshangi]|uniref:TolC family protein n=1 Tax=Sphingomonas beigongshangi TaxID=2782540 RepID=UPI0031F58DFB
MRIQARLAPALALLAGACAHYAPAPLAETPALAPALPVTTIGTPLAVEDVVALALARNPDLIAARTKLGVAQAQRVQAGVLPNPSLTGALLPLVSGAGEGPAWNLGLAQDIKALLIYKPRVRSARAATAQVRADLLWQEWQVASQARQLAVDLIAREATRPLLDEAVRILGHRYAVTQAALAEGNATLVTAAPSAVGFQQARASLQTLDQTQAQDRHKLNALLGLTPDAIVPLQPVPQLLPFDVAAARAAIPSLPARRPDLLALRFGYLAQDETLRAAILSQFPDLILGGSESSDSSRVVNVGPSAQLGLPLFDRNQGNVAIARATRAQLQAEYAARLATATGEVGALLGEMEQLRRQLAIVERDLPAARSAATRAAAAFGAAALDERAYVDLITNRFAKEQEVATLRLGLLDRQVAVSTLLGLGLPGVTTLGLADPGTRGAAR